MQVPVVYVKIKQINLSFHLKNALDHLGNLGHGVNSHYYETAIIIAHSVSKVNDEYTVLGLARQINLHDSMKYRHFVR